jgi:hypothetical protein
VDPAASGIDLLCRRGVDEEFAIPVADEESVEGRQQPPDPSWAVCFIQGVEQGSRQPHLPSANLRLGEFAAFEPVDRGSRTGGR